MCDFLSSKISTHSMTGLLLMQDLQCGAHFDIFASYVKIFPGDFFQLSVSVL